ncbi:hypothetical protein S7335_1415 [Synechococcus sp. PCC 7335]|nr:hypothetical protein S7335_1415 [Synechococcus sp. PCC 7335]
MSILQSRYRQKWYKNRRYKVKTEAELRTICDRAISTVHRITPMGIPFY